MSGMRRSSTLITSNRRAMSVLAFSDQSLRLSVSQAFSRAMANFTRPAAARSSPGAGEPALKAPQPLSLRPALSPGTRQHLTRRQRRADGYPAVDADGFSVARAGDPLRG